MHIAFGPSHEMELPFWRSATFPRYAVGAVVIFGVYYVSHLEEVPISGRRRFINVSPQLEEKLARSEYAELMNEYRDRTLPSWHPVSKMAQKVAHKLIQVTGLKKTLNWEVNVVDAPLVNALVLPGGKIFVFTGILPVVHDEEGLAAVLAHEIGHQVARHSAEKLSKTLVFFLPLTIALDAVLGMGQFSVALLQLAFMLPFSRKLESEADYIGLLLMAQACYDPKAAIDMWRRMSQYQGSKQLSYLSTHPSNDSRIKALTTWMPEAERIQENSDCRQTSHLFSLFSQRTQEAVSCVCTKLEDCLITIMKWKTSESKKHDWKERHLVRKIGPRLQIGHNDLSRIQVRVYLNAAKSSMLTVLIKKVAADIDTVFSNQIVGMVPLLKERVVEVVGEERKLAIEEIEAWVDESLENDPPSPPPPVQVATRPLPLVHCSAHVFWRRICDDERRVLDEVFLLPPEMLAKSRYVLDDSPRRYVRTPSFKTNGLVLSLLWIDTTSKPPPPDRKVEDTINLPNIFHNKTLRSTHKDAWIIALDPGATCIYIRFKYNQPYREQDAMDSFRISGMNMIPKFDGKVEQYRKWRNAIEDVALANGLGCLVVNEISRGTKYSEADWAAIDLQLKGVIKLSISDEVRYSVEDDYTVSTTRFLNKMDDRFAVSTTSTKLKLLNELLQLKQMDRCIRCDQHVPGHSIESQINQIRYGRAI
ncbi:hypothetical protein SeLEV6574_g03061 [Synchytrium endobioticum]|uniref:Peptidase M48 domain-containing protein n=1 Tax=Synchytrium endobioticum TaxID=286115 RepID=A0A507D668_9FUNG|nr:hypothetical protein SeLEV6574_g03061 [Synchytrium endobioticum]